MVAAQLVNAVPHTDAKFYAATQTMDEARHVEVFARYIEKLDEVRPIAPPLKGILDATLETDDWMKKLVGMQIVVEGLALYSLPRDAQPDRGAAAEGAAHLRRARRVAPPRLRRAVRRALRAAASATRSAPSSRTSRSRRRAR